MSLPWSDADGALVALAGLLRARGYHFTTVTPATHGRVLSRGDATDAAAAPSLRDIFGWSKPFRAGQIEPALLAQMKLAGVLRGEEGGALRSAVRASTIGGRLYFHSAYPTAEADAVFLGPDTYRFVRAVGHAVEHLGATVRRAVDIGCGAGPGAVMLAERFPLAQVYAVDINQRALALAEVNRRLAGATNVRCLHSDMLTGLDGQFDLIIANPPYLLDAEQRAYRHGGGALGAGLSLRIVEAAIARLAPGGALLLYTGVAIDHGDDGFLKQAGVLLEAAGLAWKYEEIDPDVFGEELDTPAYAGVDRIAAVLLLARKGGA
jgi:methylase of polypeptide subunit release factors